MRTGPPSGRNALQPGRISPCRCRRLAISQLRRRSRRGRRRLRAALHRRRQDDVALLHVEIVREIRRHDPQPLGDRGGVERAADQAREVRVADHGRRQVHAHQQMAAARLDRHLDHLLDALRAPTPMGHRRITSSITTPDRRAKRSRRTQSPSGTDHFESLRWSGRRCSLCAALFSQTARVRQFATRPFSRVHM